MQAARGASLNSSDPGESTPVRRPLGIFFGVAVVAFVTDLVTKTLAVARLEGREPVPVIGDFLQLTLVRNPGAAFSTGTGYTVVLTVIAVSAVVVVLVLARRLGSPLWALALGLLLAGVAGNLTDRVFRAPGPLRGHVIDFLMLPNWPVFNLADICINVAAGLILVQAFRGIRINGEGTADATAAERPAGEGL